jgi:hypothetical protein
VRAYRLVITGLQQQHPEGFDFNLAELVVARLPAKKSGENTLVYCLAVAGVAVTGFSLYFFRHYIINLFSSIAPLFIYLVATGFLTLAIFLLADMYNEHKKKMNNLDLYGN